MKLFAKIKGIFLEFKEDYFLSGNLPKYVIGDKSRLQ